MKRGNVAGAHTGGGGGKIGGGIQVFFNGKIATPRSLVPRRAAVAPTAKDSSGFRASLAPQPEDDALTSELNRAKRYTHICLQ